MSSDRQVAVYRYNSHVQPAQRNASILVARQFVPSSQAFQRHRHMSSGPSTMPGTWSPEDIREFKERRLQKERAKALADVFAGIARDPEQEEYEEYLRTAQACEAEATSSNEPSSGKNGDIDYRLASIHNPINGEVMEVTVIQDTGCRHNFMSPNIARQCNLALHRAPEIEFRTMACKFTANEVTQATWFGKDGNTGTGWFYIAPEEAPIEVLVGTQFLRDHPDAFKKRALIEPALLNVQTKMKKGEEAQVQAGKAIADAKTAELEKRKEAKYQQRQGQQRNKQSGSSSKSSKSSKRG